MTETELSTPLNSAFIFCKSAPVQLYKTNEARAYILSQPGEEYTVHYSSRRAPGEAAPTDLAVTLDVDGARLAMQRVIRTSPAPIGSKERECKFEGFRSTETTIKPFLFPCGPARHAVEPLGKISLSWFRIRIEGTNAAPRFIPPPSVSSSSSLGEARKAQQKEHLRYTWLDSRDKPFETIDFICLTRQQLIRKGFTPPPLSTVTDPAPAVTSNKARFMPAFVPASIPDPTLATRVITVEPTIPVTSHQDPAPARPTSRPAEPKLIVTQHVEEPAPALIASPSVAASAKPACAPPAPPQSALPSHLRPSASRIPPPTPPPRVQRAPQLAPIVKQEDVKPALPPCTPPKPSRAALGAALRGPAPIPSPRSRANEIEKENDRMRMEIAELENARLKRRLKELREEAEREQQAEKKRRLGSGDKLQQRRKVLETVVLD